MIAFLGMGLLGSNFAKALLNKGYEVQVWNRTYSKAIHLEQFGAKVMTEVEDAVNGADRIHLTLKDDAAVNEILEKASIGFKQGCMIIDHTTTTAHGAAERTEHWKGKGYTYLHAPVFMGPQNALESTGTMLVSGDQDLIASIEPELAKMTGKVVNFGPKNNTAAGMKLIGNLFLIALTGGIVDALSLAKGLGISPDSVGLLFNSWNPAGMVSTRLQKITSKSFDQPSWELAMARKDAGLMMHEAEIANIVLTVIPAIAGLMDTLIDKGHGHDDWTVIGKDAVH